MTMGWFRRKQHADEAEDLLYEAWAIIANAHLGCDPEQIDPEWSRAAGKWRDRWHRHIGLTVRRPQPEPQPEPEAKPKPRPAPGSGSTEIYTRDLFGTRRVTIPPLAATMAKAPMWTSETTTTWPPKSPRKDAVESELELERDLAKAINRNSRENASNTPDFVLAEYLVRCLEAYEAAVRATSGGAR